MKNKLALMICLLMVSLCAFFGCSKDPYANMTISVSGVSNDTVQQLLIEKDGDPISGYSYVYPTIELTVEVKNYGDADPNIVVSGWEGYIAEPEIEYIGDGVSTVKSQVLSHHNTRPFTLTIKTKEGNKSVDIPYSVDLKLEGYEFNEDKLVAVSSDAEIKLYEINNLITYYPEETTQKDIEYSVAVPSIQSGTNYSIDGKLDVTYIMDDELINYLSSGYKYADVITDYKGKQTLRVYPYFVDATGAKVLDEDGNAIPTIFPRRLEETTGSGETVEIDTITLRAYSEANIGYDFIDVEVVPAVTDIVLEMNSQLYDGNVTINKDKNGEFNVVMVDPKFQDGLNSIETFSYYFDRNLTFYAVGGTGDNEEVLGNYEIVINSQCKNITPDDKLPVTISMPDPNSFMIGVVNEGTYSHKFLLRHTEEKYHGLFDKEIVVNFKVLSVPYSISVNGTEINAGQENELLTTIYNVYSRGSYGTKFKIDTKSDFKYCVFLNESHSFYSSAIESLKLRRDGDGMECVYASYGSGSDGVGLLQSSKEDQNYNMFSPSSSFYLSHSFSEIPSENIIVYIGVCFTVADSSYTEEVASNFADYILAFPLVLNIENGIQSIDFTHDEYYVNLSNEDYLYEEYEDGLISNYDTGIKLWDLPVGQVYEKSIKTISYDSSLIKVYPYHDEYTNTTSLYIKYVKGASVGKTSIEIETFNGLKKSVSVETYIPTVYQNNGEVVDDVYRMPLSVSVDEYSPAYLYHLSGKDLSIHDAKWELYPSVDSTSSIYNYDSVQSLIMITNATQELRFYDYRIEYTDLGTVVTPIDITNIVDVSFSYPNYVSYSNGVLTTQNLVTLDINTPIVMTIKYQAGYESFDEEGNSTYSIYTINHKINLYIYKPLQGVEITTAKVVELYIDDSLGFYNKDQAMHTIKSTYIPNEVNLGAQWNGSELLGPVDFDAVELWYDYQDLLESVIINSFGEELKIKSMEKEEYRLIRYSDLFSIESNENYELTLRAIISNDLKSWLNTNGYTSDNAIQTVLKEQVFAYNIEFVVNVYITQFLRLQNINSVRFSVSYAEKITNIKLDVEDDGVYFEVKKNASGEWVFDKTSVEIEYTIDKTNVVNSNILLQNYETAFYSAEVISNANGTSGKIVITPKVYAGEGYLFITTEDNVRDVQGDAYTYYNNSMVLSFRIKVADGSERYPFEIKNAEDYLEMYNTTKSGYYYFYTITRDINLNGYNVYNLDVKNDTTSNKNQSEFYISGKHTYFKNNEEITTYNSIYNLNINYNLNSSGNKYVGLFGVLEECASIDNLSIKNATIVVNENKNNTANLYLGILAGSANGVNISSSSVSGSIKVVRDYSVEATTCVNIGGMIGIVSNGTISNLPENYSNGVVSTGNNSYVDIEIICNGDVNNAGAENVNVGGLVAVSNNTTISNLNVISNITSSIRATIGGVVGKTLGTQVEITKVTVAPSIVINTISTFDTDAGVIVGGVVASANYVKMRDVVVEFVDVADDVNTWQKRTNILVYSANDNAIVGGMIGQSTNSQISYSYIRSYYSRQYGDSFKGNLYIIANNGSVGGIIGCDNGNSQISYSYFDANISYSENISCAGMIIGEMSSTTSVVRYSYAIGLLYNISFVDNDNDSNIDTDAEGNLVTVLNAVDNQDNIMFSLSSSTWESDATNSTFNNYANLQKLALNISIEDTYVVANESINQFGEGGYLYHIDSIASMLNGQSIDNFFSDNLGFSITYGEDSNLTDFVWFYNSIVNTTKLDGSTYAYPVLLNGTKVMYDLVPTGINVLINERDGLYNITYDQTPQVVMFINRYENGKTDGSYYEMSIDNNSSAFVISLNGSIVSTTYVNVNNLTLNDKIEFLENSDEKIIKIEGNKIYPISTGLAKFTIRSYVSKTVKLSINILVVEGVTDYEIRYNETDVLENVTYNISGEKNETNNVVYVDEISQFKINTINQNEYIANSDFGYILELFNSKDTENGVITINGKEYSYNAGENNVYKFNAKEFNVTGIKIGKVSFAITPYINLNGVTYVDSYISGDGSTIDYSNIYILDSNLINLKKTYELNVLARAVGIENSRTSIELDAKNNVAFNVVLETANVSITDNGDDTYTIQILENLKVRINNSYNTDFELKDMIFTATLSGGVYTCINVSNTEFEYSLISLAFNSLKISKTNVNVISRNNTYKLVFAGNITFNREHYRENANTYDLNTISFNVKFIPESNQNISSSLKVSIIPSEVTTIFTNFYSKGVDKAIGGDYETEYPEYNESSFIVPGRDGLLKVTFDEEFNNSSYVTLTLDKSYQGYVTLQQLAGVVGSVQDDTDVDDILGYVNVTSLDSFETDTAYGIKLSKLSLNYLDNHYFSNTYFIKVLASKDINLSSLSIKITSYITDANNNTTEQLTKNLNLQVMELPEIKMTLNGDDFSSMGKGVMKELEVHYKGVQNDISFRIEELTSLNSDASIDHLYIADDSGERVYNLSIDYLNSGRKYYICQDVMTEAGSSWKISFNAQETLLGAIEESKCEIIIDTVKFEIESIEFCGVGNNESLNILHGATVALETKITIKDVVVGDDDEIDNFVKAINSSLEIVDVAEYAFAGTRVLTYSNGEEYVLSSGTLNLQYRQQDGDIAYYTNVRQGTYNGITITQNIRKDGSTTFVYYEIQGTTISDDTWLRLDVDYYYNENGDLIVGGDGLYVYNQTIDICVVVEDNSTYDHPTPIENQTDLENASSVEDGNFILLNNITLTNWKPLPAMFDSLDGNGYVITIESFDLSEIWGVSGADVGIFSTISQDTLVKNLVVNISPLLKTEQTMLNDISVIKASSQDTYVHKTQGIDLGYTDDVNFGVIAGTNNGAITNAKVVATSSTESKYLHILTTLGKVNGSTITSSIGGLVGVNSETGAITNSFVGVNASGSISVVENPSSVERNNKEDELSTIAIYPFVIAGGNNIGGLSCTNDGIISNSYTKGLGVYNPYPSVEESATAGLVVYNNNLLSGSFVEGNTITNYRAENDYIIESTGYIGGLVYENNATIENSYTNVYIQTLSSFIGGFVFVNNENAIIRNSYSTAVNRNSLANGQFTGVKQGVVQNYGTFENCYYLVDADNNEFENINEHATAIISTNNKFDDVSSWAGFSFVSGVNTDGIWSISENQTPKIETSLTDTISFRKVTDVSYDNIIGTIYNYSYDTYYLGTKENPLIIDKAENFDKYIIDNAYNVNGKEIFGYNSSDYATRYVRIVNNLDFETITTATEYDGTYLYKVVFAGILDGNGMTISNLNINTDNTGLSNFGLFAQVGYENSTSSAVIKNLNITVRTYKSTSNISAGILAGTIVNGNIINVSINGGNQTVSALNTAGALAGLICSTNNQPVSLIDIEIQDVKVEASSSSLGGTINSRSEDLSKHFFDSFSVESSDGTQNNSNHNFASLYDSDTKSTVISESKLKSVSYAGAVAGVVLASNYTTSASDTNSIDNYRTQADESSIKNLVVKGNVIISTADNAGGLFGYIGENTHIRDSKLVVQDGQLLKAFNNIGGIVGENHGIIEKCTVAFDSTTQQTYDSTILNNDQDNGTYNLFDMTTGEPYYTVSIGGIAGSSENGVIIDTYSKVNVVKPLSYIAGGIVGYSKSYNYIGYVYNTGAVYGQFISGGVVGLQVNNYDVNEISDYLVMENVVSLTNWSANNETTSVRGEITKKLYDNYKYMYTNTNGYSNFYIKMPEVGNAPINHTESIEVFDEESQTNQTVDLDDETIELTYRSSHTNYYVGSVIGKSLLRTGSTIYNYSSNDNYHVYASDSNWTNVFTKSSNVFSTTLGLVSTTGEVENGSRVDDYFKTSFTVSYGQDTSINSLSYRIAYNDSTLNSYDMAYDVTSDSDYLDRFAFSKVFTAQEYKQQILGNSYSATEYDLNGLVIASQSTKNIFSNGYNDSRNLPGTSGSFINLNAPVWDIIGSLPEYAYGVVSSQSEITTANELTSAFSNSSAGKTYKIMNNIEIDVYNNQNKYIEYYGGIKSMFIGENNPTVTINLAGTDNSISSMFNLWTGATFQDINFVINVSKANFADTIVDQENYGILANTIDGVYLLNCTFKVNVTNNFEINASGQNNFYAKNVGVLFGSVINSNIENCSFEITTNGININNNAIENFGLFAGNISASNINNNSFKFSDTTVSINNSAEGINIAGLAGYVANSKVSDNEQVLDDNQNNLITVDDNVSTSKNIGAMFGYASKTNIVGLETNNSMNISYQSSVNVENLNIALSVAKSNISKFNKLEMMTDSNFIFVTNTTGLITTLSIGSMIGYDMGGSQMGNAYAVGNDVDITTTVNAYNLFVGGLVGYTVSSYQLADNCYYDGDILVTNNLVYGQSGESITRVNTYVGGILGLAGGRVGLQNIIASGNITVNNIESSAKYFTTAVGGLIGGTLGNTEVSNFGAINDISNNLDVYNDTVEAYTYISGIVGYNDGIFTASNGYSYVQLPDREFTKTSSITNGVISSLCENVYYTQEFIGNNYDSDANFGSFAIADVYKNVSQYSDLYNLSDSELVLAEIGNIELYMPKFVVSEGVSKLSRVTSNSGDNKFDLTEFNSGTALTSKYNVIVSSLNNVTLSEIPVGYILSGRSVVDGKVVMTIQSSVDLDYLVETNNGVLSNIYLKTGDDSQTNKLSLVKENNGLITNCFVYGMSSNNYTIADINNGKIYSCASSIKFVNSSTQDTTLYGLVVTNNGTVSDCYSESFGYTASNDYITKVYGFAKTNNGLIQHSTYFVPKEMIYDNFLAGYVEENVENATILNCYSSAKPSALLRRSTMWEEQNSQVQIKGFVGIKGSIIVRLFVNNDEISSVKELKNAIAEAVENDSSYDLSFAYDFYVADANKPNYSVVRICNSQDFESYINSLVNGYIPENTIVLFTNNYEETISINPNNLGKISLSANSAMLGINVNGSGNVVLDFGGKTLTHEFITENKGLIADITLKNVKFTTSTENSSVAFAPIIVNNGVINNFCLTDVKVTSSVRVYVAGIVAKNNVGGILSNCILDNIYMSSRGYVNWICNNNQGTIKNCDYTSGGFVGDIYYGGV